MLEIRTRQIICDETRDIRATLPSVKLSKTNIANISTMPVRGGKKPIPRRDHQAKMISLNKYLLIYGGKNDQAFSLEQPNLQSMKTT